MSSLSPSPDTLRSYLRRFGSHSLSYSTLQPTLTHFLCEDIGYIAYRQYGPFTLVLGDPICAPTDSSRLLASFCERFTRPCFVHVTESTAAHLADMGYRCNVMGVETFVDMATFKPTWRSHNAVKESIRRFKKLNISLADTTYARLPELGLSLEDVQNISDTWLASKGARRELGFLLRPLVLRDEPDVRLIVVLTNDRLVGFTVFDPVYKNGEIVAYCPNIARFDDTHLPPGRSLFVNLRAAEIFLGEGVSKLALGLSPLVGTLRSHYRDSRALRLCFRAAPSLFPRFDFTGLSNHKRHYKGAEHIVYYATTQPLSRRIPELLAVARVIGIV